MENLFETFRIKKINKFPREFPGYLGIFAVFQKTLIQMKRKSQKTESVTSIIFIITDFSEKQMFSRDNSAMLETKKIFF